MRNLGTTLAALAVLASPALAENASNPLAAVNNTDLRYQYYDLGGGFDQQDAIIDGAFMLRPDLKFKYEAHYYSTDVSGTRENDLSRVSFKGIHFPSERKLNDTWGMRTAIGLEVILDFGDPAKGTGLGSDQIAPFGGVALANLQTGLTLIPLVQHYESYNGPTDVSQTAMRLIALQPFGDGYWAKMDLKLPYDWSNDIWPASAEFQLGKNLNAKLALYGDLFVGLGRDRLYDHGLGVGIRFKY